jgi:low temperature requirement protein LtrA
VAMIAVFVVALAIPEAWHDQPGGLSAPLVLVAAYLVVRLVHQILYFFAAGDDRALRHQLMLNLVPQAAAAGLLIAGALVDDGGARTALWAVALGVDWGLTDVTSMRGGGWRLHSVGHFVERHGLMVILALGESIVAIGVGASGGPLDWQLVVGATLGIGASVALWWIYFDVSAEAAERELARLDEAQRVRAAIESYAYLHFWLILGIVITAVGVQEALAHARDDTGLGAFAAACLFAGPATYLAGHVLAWARLHATIKVQRVTTAAALVAVIPLAARLVPLVALALLVAILTALVVFETIRYADARAELAQRRT